MSDLPTIGKKIGVVHGVIVGHMRLNVTDLVSTLAKAYLDAEHPEIRNLVEQAQELASPVLDYEEAARAGGWAPGLDQFENEAYRVEGECLYNAELDRAWTLGDWKGACEDSGIDPHEREVFGHWVVTDWLASKLEAANEKVDRDFAGLIVWARTR